MKNKAFTLVELLAVIIIIGILSALIIPKVNSSINDSNEKVNKASAQNLLDAAIYKATNNDIQGTNKNIIINYTTKENTDYLQYSGQNPEAGGVLITKQGKIAFSIKLGDKCYTKTFTTNDIEITQYNEETCNINNHNFISYTIPEVTSSGDGLYESQTEPNRLIYRGANPNNYIWLDENKDSIKQTTEMYRIMSYEPDGTIKVIRDTSIGNYVWDERTDTTTVPRHNENNTYCNYTGTYYGCNVWGNQSNTYYNNTTLTNLNQEFFYKYYPNNTDTSLQNRSNGTVTQDASLNVYLNNEWTIAQNLDDYISNHSFNVGGIYYTSAYQASQAKTLSQEKEEQNIYTWNGKIGLMNITDYVDASLNPTCTNVYSNYYYNSNYYYDSNGDGTKEQTISGYDNWPCSNRSYNWMAKGITEWSLSPNSSNRYTVWYVNSSGDFSNGHGAFSTSGVRPVFYLKQTVQLGGSGTTENPYYIIEL